jgi:double-strand break repair protein AddB
MLDAPSPRSEALAIALRLREAAETGQTAAVISPDRMLTRQITAALDQWDILPDDSAGTPLHLSPPGRFLRHIASLFHRKIDAEALLTLLKHPLTQSSSDRNTHVLNTQRLELKIRRHGLPYPDKKGIQAVMAAILANEDEQAQIDAWAQWVGDTLCDRRAHAPRPLSDWVRDHIALAEAVSRGMTGADTGELWQKKAGQDALKVMTNLQEQSVFGGTMSAADYADLIGALLSDAEVRDRDAPHPGIMIWGTLEARVQGADLVILAGLNDGTWPEAPPPDPWLNRSLRNQAGLLLPERRIGLSAHDYQQAVAAPEVWITRSIRSEDAETVASRWINRLRNLLDGLPALDGPALLREMVARGDLWLDRAAKFEAVTPKDPAKRPCPRPPVAARPRRLAVTDIKHLIRDPYAIYAKHVLRLRKLGPLVQTPDALLRGTVLHDVMETFVRETMADPSALTADRLRLVAGDILAEHVPWPAARSLWHARLTRIAEWFVTQEQARRATATPVAFEAEGKLTWADMGFELRARADRIDQTDGGAVLVYDYKTGTPPSEKEQAAFDKQLLIEAAMIEQGAFEDLGPRPVSEAVFIGLGSNYREVVAPLEKEPPAQVLERLRDLICAYLDADQGYSSRRMVKQDAFEGDYDLLARFGEWDATADPWPEDLS